MHFDNRRLIASVLLVILAAGCAAPERKPPDLANENEKVGAADEAAVADAGHVPDRGDTRNAATSAKPPPSNIWDKIRAGYALPEGRRDRVQRWVHFYNARRGHVNETAERARPFLGHIVSELERRQMPMELALLPIVESSFDPFAGSDMRAAGLWQFMPLTGKRFGLEQSDWYDGRLDVIQSTDAALDYLSWLHHRFNDWLLALAAYNAGEGTVDRAIADAGGREDYWHLDLPQETEAYVPKLLALRTMIAKPDLYGLSLPSIPTDWPAFTSVELPSQIQLSVAAELMDIPVARLRRLNPGLNHGATRPDGPHRLLVPTDQAKRLRQAVAERDASELLDWPRHTVDRGETLSGIATRHGIDVATLRAVNDLDDDNLVAGTTLHIPDIDATRNEPRIHEVDEGESLWIIARRYGVSVAQLRSWNALGSDTTLHPGDRLSIYGGNETAERRYTVERGDSLWEIARRFGVRVSDLRAWNTLPEEAVLQPGQTLVVSATGVRIVYHEVRRGDSLWSIASRYSVAVAQLRNWNGLDGRGYIHPGQRLKIKLDTTG